MLVSGLLTAARIAGTGLAVVSLSFVFNKGCQQLANAGYAKAEADRLEDMARETAETVEKLRKDGAASRDAVKAWKAKAKRETRRAEEAIAARRAAGEGGQPCAPGCVYSPPR